MKKILFALVPSLFFFSCTDQDDKLPPVTGPDPDDFYTLFDTALETQTQTFQMNAEDGYTVFTSAQGVKLAIDGNCLQLDGQPVTGAVDIEFVEIFDRGTMLTTNKTTMGLHNGEKHLLISGGEFYVNATQNGQQLTLTCSYELYVPTAITGGTDNDMLPFNGTLDAMGNVTWEQWTGGEWWIGSVNGNADSYNAIMDHFGWFNCDKFMNTAGPHTTISAFVPQGYGNGNSMVFIATSSQPNSLGAVSGQYPVGLECHLIFVSENNGNYIYSILQDQTLVENHQVTFHANEMQTATAEQLVAIINALP
ncbi:hypothetical protein [Flavobacterium suncheonense]|uniref:Lipoprotein n=1 Tax=Flavobacterium suncheonense GH29-5 = DSM 17707 TaxID=1121899 RepID=A0A0A2MG45_9FLAO|nr:hypothetical protein [Flavobacterium suncheonense]KGO90438.1 hypothetical protein Q764_02480 [Flavobacterium suncheonense GH29-5 = DSM 17707]